MARILQNMALSAPLWAYTATFSPLVAAMQSSLVVDALKEQLLQVLDWYQHGPPRFRWGTVIHCRNERGRLRFGAITPQGESLLLSEPLLDGLAGMTCWLDGAVRVRLESRRVGNQHPWLDGLARSDRAPLVEAMAVYFNPDSLARRGDGVPGDGRGPDAHEMPDGAVPADQGAAGGVAAVSW